MPSLADQLEQAQQARAEAELKLQEELSKKEKKAAEERVKE